MGRSLLLDFSTFSLLFAVLPSFVVLSLSMLVAFLVRELCRKLLLRSKWGTNVNYECYLGKLILIY